MADIIPWAATAATIVAALITAANLGTRITGYGFCVFLAGSLAWIVAGLLQGDQALTVSNVILTLTNMFGIWRWLGRESKVEEGAQVAARDSRASSSETLFPLDLLTKADVISGKDKLGACVNAMAGCDSGRIAYVVVSTGGVGGVGETLRRFDWKDIAIAGDRVTATIPPGAVNRLPELERDEWPGR